MAAAQELVPTVATAASIEGLDEVLGGAAMKGSPDLDRHGHQNRGHERSDEPRVVRDGERAGLYGIRAFRIAAEAIADGHMAHERIATRTIRVAVFSGNELLVEGRLAPGADIVLGRGSNVSVPVSTWLGADLLIVAAGDVLCLAPGMRVTMCHDQGEDWLDGSYDELVARGISFPLQISVSKINVKPRPGYGVLIHFESPTETL